MQTDTLLREENRSDDKRGSWRERMKSWRPFRERGITCEYTRIFPRTPLLQYGLFSRLLDGLPVWWPPVCPLRLPTELSSGPQSAGFDEG